jgi:quercetin dioxygenase-like cupin family protein
VKPKHIFLLVAFILVAQSAALALEPSGPVQVTPLLKTQTTWNGKPIEYPKGQAEVSSFVFEIAPGAETGWHLHPISSFAYMLQGELEVRLKSGEHKRFKSGDAFAEVVNTLHNGRNIGTVPVRIAVFYAGEAGSTLTIKEADLGLAKPARDAGAR